MNSQEKKAWLRQCAALDRDIDRLILERSRWMARATRMVPTLSDMPRGGGERRSSEDIILRIAEIENEIDRKIDALLDQRAAVVEAITAVGDRQLREVLELRMLFSVWRAKKAPSRHGKRSWSAAAARCSTRKNFRRCHPMSLNVMFLSVNLVT